MNRAKDTAILNRAREITILIRAGVDAILSGVTARRMDTFR